MADQSDTPAETTPAATLKFAAFMAGPIGRIARIALGVALIVAGLAAGGTGGIILAIVGVAPLAMGISNRCIISRIIGAPWRGQDALEATA